MKPLPNPFKPYVTLEQVFAFDKDCEETFTPSRELNAILTAFDEPGLHAASDLGHYLAISPATISGICKAATGHTFPQLRRKIQLHRADVFLQDHPDATPEEISHALGYKDRTGYWQLINARHINAKRRQVSEFWRNLSPAEREKVFERQRHAIATIEADIAKMKRLAESHAPAPRSPKE